MAVCTCYIHIIPNVAVLYNYPPLSTPSHANLVPRIHLNFLAFAHIVRCHLLPEMATGKVGGFEAHREPGP